MCHVAIYIFSHIGNNGNINLYLFSIYLTQIGIFWAPDTCLVHQVVYILTFNTRVYKLKLNFQSTIQYLPTINYP